MKGAREYKLPEQRKWRVMLLLTPREGGRSKGRNTGAYLDVRPSMCPSGKGQSGRCGRFGCPESYFAAEPGKFFFQTHTHTHTQKKQVYEVLQAWNELADHPKIARSELSPRR